MKKNWKIFWEIFGPIAVAITFAVFFFLGIKHRKKITNGRVRYFFRISVEALRHPFDGFDFLPKRNRKKRVGRILSKVIKRMVKILKRPFVFIEWEDD